MSPEEANAAEREERWLRELEEIERSEQLARRVLWVSLVGALIALAVSRWW